MNKRTIVLISICFLLAIATVTMRYIEQEKKSIKDQFGGKQRIEERSPRTVSPSRDGVQKAMQAETMSTPAGMNAQGSPESMPVTAAAVTTIAVVPSVQSEPGLVEATKPTSTTVIQSNKTDDANSILGQPATEVIEDVKTPLGSEEPNELQDSSMKSEIPGEAERQEAARPGAEEASVDAAQTEAADDSGTPATAEKKTDEAVEETGIEEEEPADEDSDMVDDYQYQDGEMPDEGRAYPLEDELENGQGAAEEEMFLEEEESGEEEGGTGEAAEQAEDFVDEEGAW